MKTLTLAALMIACSGCAAHKQLACRFVAVDRQGTILKQPTSAMHSHWHKGLPNCESMIDALASGLIQETTTGNIAGVEVRGPKALREKLKRLMLPEPAEKLGVAVVRHPSFKVLEEIAE